MKSIAAKKRREHLGKRKGIAVILNLEKKHK